MLTVIPHDVSPLPLVTCSFRMAYPTPGRSTRVFGATSVTTAVPLTTSPVNPDPPASLPPANWVNQLEATAVTIRAVIAPPATLTFSTSEVLCAPDFLLSPAPVVTAL